MKKEMAVEYQELMANLQETYLKRKWANRVIGVFITITIPITIYAFIVLLV